MAAKSDPTEPIRLKASKYKEVIKGTACTQSAFKTAKSAFLYIGMQGGRYKAMFKLDRSRGEAEKLAAKHPDLYETGSTSWVTARFTAEKPMPSKLWQKWLDESYQLSLETGKQPSKTTKKKTAKKKTVKKKTAPKKTGKKKTVAKKASGKKKSAGR